MHENTHTPPKRTVQQGEGKEKVPACISATEPAQVLVSHLIKLELETGNTKAKQADTPVWATPL